MTLICPLLGVLGVNGVEPSQPVVPKSITTDGLKSNSAALAILAPEPCPEPVTPCGAPGEAKIAAAQAVETGDGRALRYGGSAPARRPSRTVGDRSSAAALR